MKNIEIERILRNIQKVCHLGISVFAPWPHGLESAGALLGRWLGPWAVKGAGPGRFVLWRFGLGRFVPGSFRPGGFGPGPFGQGGFGPVVSP